MRDLHTLAALAGLEVAGMPDAEPAMLAGVTTTLAFCDMLGQLLTLDPLDERKGFVAWLRCYPCHVTLFRNRDFDAIRQLHKRELTRGPILVIAETYTDTPRAAAIAAYELSKMGGLTHICAFVYSKNLGARRFRIRPVHRRAMRKAA